MTSHASSSVVLNTTPNLDTELDPGTLKKGFSVLLNDAFVVVGELGYNDAGPIAKIADVIPDGRLRIGQEPNAQTVILERSADLTDVKLKPGDEVRVDSNYRVALEHIATKETDAYALEAVPNIPWSKVGGLDETIQRIKDTIELPDPASRTLFAFPIQCPERVSPSWTARMRKNAHR